MMNYQDVLDVLSRTKSANVLTQQGIERLDESNLEDALSAFQASFEENPKSLPKKAIRLIENAFLSVYIASKPRHGNLFATFFSRGFYAVLT